VAGARPYLPRPCHSPPGTSGSSPSPGSLGKERASRPHYNGGLARSPPGSSPSLEETIFRYLGAFGPATVKDVQTWSGLSRLGEVIERLRGRLRIFRDESGKELFDVPDAPMPDPDTPAPPRFLPEFDNLILSHADRTRVIAEEYRKAIASKNGMVPASVLVDGFVRGTWKTERSRGKASLEIKPFEPLTKEDRDALAEEGERLIRFVAVPDGAASYEIRFAEPWKIYGTSEHSRIGH
jgi:hypothetical protein